MWFIVLWCSLGAILVANAALRRRWVTGQTAFTGIWFTSLTGLWVFPPAQEFISAEATLLVILAHVSFFLGSTVVYKSCRRTTVAALEFAPTARTQRTLVHSARVLICLGTTGSWLAARSSGAFGAFQGGVSALMRSSLFDQTIEVPLLARLLSNCLYPAAVIGAMCYLLSKRPFGSWLYIVLPVAGSMLYGFAFGGRGAVIMVVPMIVWVLAIGRRRLASTTWGDRLLFICVVAVVILFAGAMLSTRMDSTEAVGSIWQYFTMPLPAFSQWLTLGPLPLINADFANLAPVREAMRLFGFVNERTIGIDVVSVPFDFNVYTYLAEQLRAFGIVGAMVVAFLLGALSSVLERKAPTASVVGVRATLYAYLSFSLFADMAFFIVGWWLTLFMVVIVVPFGARFVSRTHAK